MKSFFLVVLLVNALVIAQAKSMFQLDHGVFSGPIIQQESPVESYYNALDGLEKLFIEAKSSVSKDVWQFILIRLKGNDVSGAFSNCGELSGSFESRFISLYNQLVKATQALRSSVMAIHGNLTEAEIGRIAIQELDNYVNSLSLERFAPLEIGLGPGILAGGAGQCEETLRLCIRAAKRARNAGWWSCAMGGLGLSLVLPGPGLVIGTACITQNQLDYEEAVRDCERTYNTCILNQPQN